MNFLFLGIVCGVGGLSMFACSSGGSGTTLDTSSQRSVAAGITGRQFATDNGLQVAPTNGGFSADLGASNGGLSFNTSNGGINVDLGAGNGGLNFDPNNGGVTFDLGSGNGGINFDTNNGRITVELGVGNGALSFDTNNGGVSIDLGGSNGSVNFDPNNGHVIIDLGGSNGVISFDPNNGSVSFDPGNGAVSIDPNNGTITIDLGSGNGVALVDPINGGFTVDLGGSNGAISFDASNGTWVIDVENGVISFDPNNDITVIGTLGSNIFIDAQNRSFYIENESGLLLLAFTFDVGGVFLNNSNGAYALADAFGEFMTNIAATNPISKTLSGSFLFSVDAGNNLVDTIDQMSPVIISALPAKFWDMGHPAVLNKVAIQTISAISPAAFNAMEDTTLRSFAVGAETLVTGLSPEALMLLGAGPQDTSLGQSDGNTCFGCTPYPDGFPNGLTMEWLRLLNVTFVDMSKPYSFADGQGESTRPPMLPSGFSTANLEVVDQNGQYVPINEASLRDLSFANMRHFGQLFTDLEANYPAGMMRNMWDSYRKYLAECALPTAENRIGPFAWQRIQWLNDPGSMEPGDRGTRNLVVQGKYGFAQWWFNSPLRDGGSANTVTYPNFERTIDATIAGELAEMSVSACMAARGNFLGVPNSIGITGIGLCLDSQCASEDSADPVLFVPKENREVIRYGISLGQRQVHQCLAELPDQVAIGDTSMIYVPEATLVGNLFEGGGNMYAVRDPIWGQIFNDANASVVHLTIGAGRCTADRNDRCNIYDAPETKLTEQPHHFAGALRVSFPVERRFAVETFDAYWDVSSGGSAVDLLTALRRDEGGTCDHSLLSHPDSTLQTVKNEKDTDGDGIADSLDNCKARANPGQLDADGDFVGNACDADFNNDCRVDAQDSLLLDQAIAKHQDNTAHGLTSIGSSVFDLNADGLIDADDQRDYVFLERTMAGMNSGVWNNCQHLWWINFVNPQIEPAPASYYRSLQQQGRGTRREGDAGQGL